MKRTVANIVSRQEKNKKFSGDEGKEKKEGGKQRRKQ